MKLSISALLLLLLASTLALAQRYEVSASGSFPILAGASLGSISAESIENNDTNLRGQYGYGVRLTRNTRGYYGHEVGYTRSQIRFRTTFRSTADNVTTTTTREDRVNMQQINYNFLIYFMPNGERWRPFVTGGLEGARYSPPRFAEWPGGGSRNWGVNWGGGLKVKLFPHALMRLDVRDYITGKPYGNILQFNSALGGVGAGGGVFHQLEASAGFGIAF
jgi:hypothetical protein